MADNGFPPVPVLTGRKKPVVLGWTRWCHTPPTEAEIELWPKSWPDHLSTGLALGRHVAVDVDVVSDPQRAAQLRALAVEHFGGTPFIRVGRWPKAALVYRCAEPIATERFAATDGSG